MLTIFKKANNPIENGANNTIYNYKLLINGNKYKRVCSITQVIRGKHIKTTVTCHFLLGRLGENERTVRFCQGLGQLAFSPVSV